MYRYDTSTAIRRLLCGIPMRDWRFYNDQNAILNLFKIDPDITIIDSFSALSRRQFNQKKLKLGMRRHGVERSIRGSIFNGGTTPAPTRRAQPRTNSSCRAYCGASRQRHRDFGRHRNLQSPLPSFHIPKDGARHACSGSSARYRARR